MGYIQLPRGNRTLSFLFLFLCGVLLTCVLHAIPASQCGISRGFSAHSHWGANVIRYFVIVPNDFRGGLACGTWRCLPAITIGGVFRRDVNDLLISGVPSRLLDCDDHVSADQSTRVDVVL